LGVTLRLDYPLLVAQCLREHAFPEDNEKFLAAVVAVFAYDRDDEIKLTVKDPPPKLMLSFKKVILAVRPLAHRLEAAGFATAKLHPSAGIAMYYWAQGTQLGVCHQGHGNCRRRYGFIGFAHS